VHVGTVRAASEPIVIANGQWWITVTDAETSASNMRLRS
jgi:hypothetical protein